jgi:hypothetical protein
MPGMATFTRTDESAVQVSADSSVHPITAEIRSLRGEAPATSSTAPWCPGRAPRAGSRATCRSSRPARSSRTPPCKQIDAKRHPTVRYEVRSVEDAGGSFNVTGPLTFAGATREFTETCNARIDGARLIVDAEHTVDITSRRPVGP